MREEKGLKIVVDNDKLKFANSKLAKAPENNNKYINYDFSILKRVNEPIKNKLNGQEIEKNIIEELKEKYPKEDGYQIITEIYLRDKDGKIVKDPVTEEARRIDFIVIKNGRMIDSVELKSKVVDKEVHIEKENRIRDKGGIYIRDNVGNVC